MTETKLRPRAVYLRGESEPAFALFHDAMGHRAPTAVMICPPFGHDPMSPYRSRWDWADHLAAQGYPTLRLDLPGTGDSPGEPSDGDRLDTWSAAVSIAARWLRTETDAARIVAAGVGLGGLVAYRATVAGACIDDFVLWAVPASGRALVRELCAYARLPSAGPPSNNGATSSLAHEGAVVAAGYLLSSETASALDALDLRDLHLANPRRRRVLLVGRSGARVDAQLRTFLEREGIEVTVARGPGYRERREFFARVTHWLRTTCAARGDTTPARGASSCLEAVSTRSERVSAHEHLTIDHGGGALRETPSWIERPTHNLIGVLAEPLERTQHLSIVLLGGARRHTGPCRLWVTIARQWAARGVPSLRFDMPGIGDSEGPSDPNGSAFCDLMPLSAPEYLDAASAALDMLVSRGLPDRFVLVGLCSGGYWALRTALRDRRVAGVIMLNPPALTWNDQIAESYLRVQRRWTARSLRNRLLVAETWRKLATGKVSPARCLSLAWQLGALRARDACREATLRSRPGKSRAEEIHRPATLFDNLRDRDQTGVLMLTGDEPLRDELAAEGVLGQTERWPNLEIVLAGDTHGAHSLTPLWVQQQVLELVDRVVQRELERAVGGKRPRQRIRASFAQAQMRSM